MSRQVLVLEDRCRLLELAIHESVQKKRIVEARIRQQVQELKKLEIAVEKRGGTCGRRGLGSERSRSWLE